MKTWQKSPIPPLSCCSFLRWRVGRFPYSHRAAEGCLSLLSLTGQTIGIGLGVHQLRLVASWGLVVYPIIYRVSEPSTVCMWSWTLKGRLKKLSQIFEDFRISPEGGNPQLPTSSKRAREAGPISPSGLAWASQEIEGIGTQNVGFHLVILRLQYSKCWTGITLRAIKVDFGFNLTPSFGQLLRRLCHTHCFTTSMGLAPSQHRAVQQIDIHRLEMQCSNALQRPYGWSLDATVEEQESNLSGLSRSKKDLGRQQAANLQCQTH